jgi:hypothetical protein
MKRKIMQPLFQEDGTRAPMDVSPGDVVYYGLHAGTEFKADGLKVLLMRQSDIVCRIVESDEEVESSTVSMLDDHEEDPYA